MWKSAVAAMSLLFLANAGTAEQAVVSYENDPAAEEQAAGDFAALAEARIAALKAALELTPDQQSKWSVLESALRDNAMLRSEQIAHRQDDANRRHEAAAEPDVIALVQRRAEALSAAAATLKRVADATAPLYESLDARQRQRFVVLARALGPYRTRTRE